jgi:hypothetical protein
MWGNILTHIGVHHTKMKGGNECVDYVDYFSGEGVEGDTDGGGEK